MAEKKEINKIEALVGQISRQFGDGAIMRLGAATVVSQEAISTGNIELDMATGIGGYPKGRVSEIYGAESSGKTTLTLHAVANAQKGGGVAAFIDAEHALDPLYAKKLGVDIDNLLISQPDTGEQALEITDTLVKSGAVELVVIDSVAALVPRAELEGEMGDVHMGLQARLMSQALRKLSGNVRNSNCCVIFINQVREKIGVMFGNPQTTPGGRALKFYASLRLEIRRMENLKDGPNVIGNRAQAKIVKNKFAPPFRNVEFDIIYGDGMCPVSALIDAGLKYGVITQKGAWFLAGEDRLGQGREKVRRLLKGDSGLFESLNAATREKAKEALAAQEAV